MTHELIDALYTGNDCNCEANEVARRVREGHGKAAYALLTSLMISVIAIQVLAGIDGGARRLQTSFEPLEPRDETLAAPLDYGARSRIPLLHRLFDRAIISLHRH